MSRLDTAVVDLHRAEHALLADLERTVRVHRAEHGVHHVARDLADWSREHVHALATWASARGLAVGAPAVRPDRATPADPGLALLADLRRLHLDARAVTLDWEILAQTAQALRERDLLDLAERCAPESRRQATWAEGQLKQSAAQVMVSR